MMSKASNQRMPNPIVINNQEIKTRLQKFSLSKYSLFPRIKFELNSIRSTKEHLSLQEHGDTNAKLST